MFSMLLYRTQTQSLSTMRDVKRFSTSKAWLRLKSVWTAATKMSLLFKIERRKVYKLFFSFEKKISVDIFLRKFHISMPPLRLLKLSKKIDSWENLVHLWKCSNQWLWKTLDKEKLKTESVQWTLIKLWQLNLSKLLPVLLSNEQMPTQTKTLLKNQQQNFGCKSEYGQCLLFSVERLKGHPTSKFILVTPWSQYLSMLNHILAIPLHPRIAMPWQKLVPLEISHSAADCVGNRKKLGVWSLSPLHLYDLQKGLDTS